MLRLQKAMLHRVLLAKARPILQKPSAPIHFPSRLVVRSRSTAQLQRPARLSTRALNSQLVHQSLKQPRQQPRILASSSPSLSSTSSVPLASGGGGGHVPPLLVRGSLVGATTALLTPLFPIIGFNQLVFRFVSPAGRVAIHGGTSMLYFSAMVLAPDAFFYAPVLLPFAIGNGVVASAAYVVAEGVAGGPAALAAMKIGPVPVAGPLIGAATALLAPNVYPACFAVVWPNLGPGSSSYVFDPAAYVRCASRLMLLMPAALIIYCFKPLTRASHRFWLCCRQWDSSSDVCMHLFVFVAILHACAEFVTHVPTNQPTQVRIYSGLVLQ